MATPVKQSNEQLLKRWMNISQHVAQDSVSILQDYMRHPTAVDALYEKSITLAHEAVNETLQLERDQLAELEKNEPELPAVKDGVDLATAMTRAGIDMRSQLWESWFKSAETFNPAKPGSVLDAMKNPSAVFDAWREATDRLFETAETGGHKPRASGSKAKSGDAADQSA